LPRLRRGIRVYAILATRRPARQRAGAIAAIPAWVVR